MKIAIVVGHTEGRPGAKNIEYDMSEFTFNKKLAYGIKDKLDLDSEIVYRKVYRRLPHQVNYLKPSLVVSLHCNAFNRKASGTETLYYHTSTKGRKIAQIFNENFVNALGLKDRGVKGKCSEDRGGYLLRYTKAPCIITEPFFIDNDDDYEVVVDNYDDLVMAYVNSINEVYRMGLLG